MRELFFLTSPFHTAPSGQTSFTKIIGIALLLFLSVSESAFALNTRAELISADLPVVKFTSDSSHSFHIYGSKYRNFVLVESLNLRDLQKLKTISRKASLSFTRISNSSQCQNYMVNSGSLGYVTNSDSGESIDFEVICNGNETLLYISMRDKFVMNYVLYKVSPETFEHWISNIETNLLQLDDL